MHDQAESREFLWAVVTVADVPAPVYIPQIGDVPPVLLVPSPAD